MSRAFSRNLGSGVLFVALLTLPLRPAWADYKQDYLKAHEAIDKGSWTEAATLLRRVVRDESRENARIKYYGTYFDSYVPHFYLGEALFKLGQCDEAVSELDESERQGVIQGLSREYDRLKSYREQCRGSARPPVPTVPVGPTQVPPPTARGVDPRLLREAQQRAQTAIADASRVEEAIKGLRRKPDYQSVWEQRADLTRRLEQASANLERARTLQGREAVADLDTASGLAADARKELEDVQKAASAAVDRMTREGEQAREAHRQELVRDIGVLMGPAEQLLAEGGRLPGPTRTRLERELRTLEVVVNSARSPAGLSVMRLESLKQQLGIAASDLEQAMQRAAQGAALPTPSPALPVLPTSPAKPLEPRSGRGKAPPELRSAVAAFLRADYRTTLGTLEHIDFSQPRADAVGLLFRAAARYLLYLEGGQRSSELKESATADLRAMRAKDPSVVPQREVFSPAFIEFCNGVR